MSIANLASPPITKKIVYPESDGKPMADNSKQFRWIVTIEGNLESLFANDPNVFVAGDMLWYPVEEDNMTRIASDAMVVFGRPKGDRGSYLQWLEGGIAPQVVFEVLSPGNRKKEMDAKFDFYDRFGVEEYYLYDPHRIRLQGWLRDHGKLKSIKAMSNWTSPRLGIWFDITGPELTLHYPNGQRFLTFLELSQARAEAEARNRELEAKLRQAGLL